MAVETISVCDPTLLGDIRRYGKFDPTGCYQCGSCTLTCDLVDGGATFPRRSIRFALLGLRQPLVKSLDPWLCHDCGDCSVACPRQAEPRISMLTLRRFLSAQYDWTGIAPKLLQSTAWYLGSLIFVAALTFLLILGYHLWYVKMPATQLVTTPLGLEHMFPLIIYYTLTVALLPMLLVLSRVFRIWRLTMSADERAHIPFSAYVAEFGTYVEQSVTHSLMRKCPDRGRWLGHWCLALGTVMMLTIKVFGLKWFQTDNLYPFYNPQRWLGYLATGLIFYGMGEIFPGPAAGAEGDLQRDSVSGPGLSHLAGVDRAQRSGGTHLPLCRLWAHLSFAVRPSRCHRHSHAAGGDVVWQVGPHGLSTASPVFPGGQAESRAASAGSGGGPPCRLTVPRPRPWALPWS